MLYSSAKQKLTDSSVVVLKGVEGHVEETGE
jgi:hypothetical protein